MACGESAEKDSAKRAEEFRILQRVAVEINSALELEDIYKVALETMDELFEFHHSIILLLDKDGEELRVVASRGYEGQAVGGRVPVGVGVIGVVAKKRRYMHVSNLGQQRAYISAQRRELVASGRTEEIGESIPVPGLPNAESQIAVPLMVKDALIGVFSVESNVRRTFNEHERDLIMIVANQTASATQAALMHAALRDANEKLEQRVAERTAELEHRLRVAEEFLKDARERVDGPLLGESDPVRRLRESIALLARTDDTVLIAGPAGTGKEATARAIHGESERRRGPFIYTSCARLRTTDPASPDAATADSGGVPDKLDLAVAGTLFLDGVNDLPIDLQRQLLDVLTKLECERREGRTPERDVRVIVSSTRDLFHEVQASLFLKELYELLNARRISVPSLIDRSQDIPILVEHFIRKHSRRLGKSVSVATEGSMARLRSYTWPGNVRELENVLERAIIVARGTTLEIDEEMLASVSIGGYRLVERLGSGGMGEVWLGRHRLLARPAAVKLIRSEKLGHDETRRLAERFEREAQVTANLRSPNTVQLYDFGISDSGAFYYVMEFLDGMDVGRMVKRFGPMAPERVIILLRQACRSLIEAHDQTLVHRDIKPENLFVTNLGPDFDFVKVLDFGMVKAHREKSDVQLTVEGTAAGTPAFMAPELAMGRSDVDGRADLYSLGCLAYWMLTGMLVFEAENAMQMILHHVQTPPRPPSALSEIEIPAELEAIVMRCLAKSPDERPATASELWESLGEVKCAAPWTQTRAREWWRAHVPELRRPVE